MKPSNLKLIDFPDISFNKEDLFYNTKINVAIYEGRRNHRNSIFEQDVHKRAVYLYSAAHHYTQVINFKEHLINTYLEEYVHFSCLQRSIIYSTLKEYNKSLSDLSCIINSNSIYQSFALFERAMNNLNQAIEIFERQNPNMFLTPTTFLSDPSQIGYLSNALLSFNQLINHNQFLNDSRYNRGLIYCLQHKYIDAINDFNFIINLGHKNYYPAIFQKAVCTYHLSTSVKNDTECKSLLETALADFNKVTQATFNHNNYLLLSNRLCYQGHILLKLGNVEDGLTSYSRALELQPDLTKYLAKSKELIFNAIKNIKDDTKAINFLNLCIDDNYKLGKIMWQSRGKSPCSLSTGILKQCVNELNRRSKNIDNSQCIEKNNSMKSDSSVAKKSANTKSIYNKITQAPTYSPRRSSSLKNFSELKTKNSGNIDEEFVLLSKTSSSQDISAASFKPSEPRKTKIQKKVLLPSLFQKKKLTSNHTIELSGRDKENNPLQSANRNIVTCKRVL